MSLSYWLKQWLKRWRMLVWLASINPLTLCADCAYGDFLDSATCHRFACDVLVCFVKQPDHLQDCWLCTYTIKDSRYATLVEHCLLSRSCHVIGIVCALDSMAPDSLHQIAVHCHEVQHGLMQYLCIVKCCFGCSLRCQIMLAAPTAS